MMPATRRLLPSNAPVTPNKRAGPTITDVPGRLASATQLKRLLIRYQWASTYCVGADVVDAACGTGQGLNLLNLSARRVHGADLSRDNLTVAHATYGGRIPLGASDAESLPIADQSVDVVVFLETLYFLASPETFIAEARRVLRPGGKLLLSVINKDCGDYNLSPLYSRHFGCVELSRCLLDAGFSVQCYGAIPMDQPSLRERVFRPIKRLAAQLHLIPNTMQGREWIKRVVFGRLDVIPREITPDGKPYHAPERLSSSQPDKRHQVILCVATKPT